MSKLKFALDYSMLGGMIGRFGKGLLRSAEDVAVVRLGGKDFFKNHLAERAYKGLPAGHVLGDVYQQNKLLKNLNLESGNYKNIVGAMKDFEKGPLEINKLSLENKKLENELAKQNTFAGRMSRSSVGQLVAPLVGGALLTGGGMMMNSAVNTASAFDIPNPLIEMKIKGSIPEVLKIKPELRSVPSDLLIRYYRLIFKLFPNIASDENTAANALWQLYQTGGSDASISKIMSEVQRSSYREPLQSAITTMGLGHKLFI